MWDQAVNEVRSALDDVGLDDRVSIMSFDQNAQTLIGFEQWAQMPLERRASVTNQQISELSPGWAPTNLGHALVSAEIVNTRRGMRAVGWSFAALMLTVVFQAAVVFYTGSVALPADTIHNFGDAAGKKPVPLAGKMRSDRTEP